MIGAVVTFRDRTHERERDRVRRELFAARSVQERLYPARSPHVPGFDVAAAAFPAEEACGDYHDFLPQPDGTLGVVVGDVSGHGLGPALVMVQTRALLRTGFTADRTPAEVLNRLHDQLEPDLHDETYVTMLLGRLDPRTRRLEYAAAGHVGWHVAADGTPRRLDSTGAPLGLRLIPGMLTEPGPPLTLDPGDVLLLATDGVEEAMDAGGVCFGRDRVLRVVADRRGAPAAEIIARLHAACPRPLRPRSPEGRHLADRREGAVRVAAAGRRERSLRSRLMGDLSACSRVHPGGARGVRPAVRRSSARRTARVA